MSCNIPIINFTMLGLLCLFILVKNHLAVEYTPNNNFSGKIIGGSTVSIEEYPYQLSLQYMNNHLCGASILSQKFAITAAHCTQGVDSRFLSVHSGITSLDDTNGQIIQVAKIHQHPNFNFFLMDYDLSIIELDEDIELNKRSLPINIVETNKSLVGEVGVVTGWGVDREEGGDIVNNLQAVEVPILDHEICGEKYKGISPVTPRMLCAEDQHGGKDACQGDSGGPFAVNGELVGVVSWGWGCGKVKYPGVYANISAMRKFVKQVLEK